MEKETQNILVDRRILEVMNGFLQCEERIPDEPKDVIQTFTCIFNDGFEADIKVCNGDGPYVDSVLFDPDGTEVQVLDVGDQLDGVYQFEYGHKLYIVQVMGDYE